MAYIPNRGDIVWLNFSPHKGHEQKGKRPAIVISPKAYNQKTSLALCCPITSNVKDYPFEVDLKGKKVSGVILADHLKNLDWKARKIKFIEKAKTPVVNECIEKISVLIL
jgi:mRNA interferase MazF